MKKLSFLFIWGLIAISLISCGEESGESSIETPEITFEKEGEMYLIKQEDTIQQLDIELAESPYEQETGLMYRESMEDQQGMLFIYEREAVRNFYMKNTYIPLDLIFYDSDSTIVHIHENARPLDETTIPSNEPAQFILEVNAGKAEEWGLETGDRMSFNRQN